ncbi:MAG: phage portal protein [Devosia sp.]
MSALLKALAWVSPTAAVKRAQAFRALDLSQRYAGATVGRRGAGWRNANTGANNAIGQTLTRLRARSHEMVRDHWAFSRILDVMVSHAIGHGIQVLPDNGSDPIDRRVKELFSEWADTADVTGEGDLHGLTALQVRAMLEGGSSLIRFVPRRLGDGERKVPLALAGLEGEHIDHAQDGEIDGRRVRLGTALGPMDERQGYYLFRDHPTDAGASRLKEATQSTFFGRDDVVHLFRALRPNQLIGVPIFAPILMTARDLADLLDATIIQSKTAACFGAFVLTQDDGVDPLAGQTAAENGQQITRMEPGMVARLRHGEDVKFASPPDSKVFEPAYTAGLYAMAAGAGVTHDQLTGDLRGANYSSLRAGKIEFRRLIEQLQWLTIIPKMHARIARRWAETAVMAGVLRTRREGYRWRYVVPANEPIDPKKDIEADILAVQSGRMSPQEFIAGYGRDWQEVVSDFGSFMAEIDKAGITLKIDPRVDEADGNQVV